MSSADEKALIGDRSLECQPVYARFPESVRKEIEQRLGVKLSHISLLQSGLHHRTYRMESDSDRWVARLLRPDRAVRAVRAQQRAAEAGLRTPRIVAYSLPTAGQTGCPWAVEEYVKGSEFYPERFDRREAKAISVDLGRQLRLLHTVCLDGYGYLAGSPLRGKYASWDAWVRAEWENIDPAAVLAGIGSRGKAQLEERYRLLQRSFTGPGRLCHGDFAADNLLVRGGQLAAVVDWETAMACDPAHDVAYWFLWHEDRAYLDAFLQGYAPDDPGAFPERVLAHYMLLATQFIIWYSTEGDSEGVEYCRNVLMRNVGQRAHPVH
jgi:aminoglycoside phosphotransferase (APT) family kinase protein